MPIRVVACVIERDGKLLLCRRPAHKRHGGLWEFPGGKVENGETDGDAIQRELDEELDLSAREIRTPEFSFYDASADVVISFHRVAVTGEPQLKEHEELTWVWPWDASKLDLAPGDKRFVMQLATSSAYYHAAGGDFAAADPLAVLGALGSGSASAGFAEVKQTQTVSWEDQIVILQHGIRPLKELAATHIVLEYPIPRREKRPDVVLVFGNTIVVIEFKRDAKKANRSYVDQVLDYCLDLRDFHSQSRGRRLIPVLLLPDSGASCAAVPPPVDAVTPVVLTGAAGLSRTLLACFAEAGVDERPAEEWVNGDYSPTPTIIEAARHLYAKMDVREIARSHAGADNLAATAQALHRAIEDAREHSRKVVCFVTGVPGAGKTLAGLNFVHNAVQHSAGELAVFLSGNGPLVEVLQEALARDEARRTGDRIREARRRAETFVQNVHGFLDIYSNVAKVPPEQVVVFDEAQRAWDKDHWRRKTQRRISLRRKAAANPYVQARLANPASEPELILEIMDRKPGWAVVVGLVGGGQEINTGEAGLSEWGRVLARRFPDWRILVSRQLLEGDHSTEGDRLFASTPRGLDVRLEESLHLSVSLRSYRAEKLSEWVSLVLRGDPVGAAAVAAASLTEYPIRLTRSLSDARRWLRKHRRGSRRSGMLATSEARRLRQDGFDVNGQINVRKWFLAPVDHVESSCFLELAATEFAVQGLEVDWACVCWDGDVRRSNDQWTFHRFRGNKWTDVHKARIRDFMLNKYRVLLTRAREGLVVWVPPGSDVDKTREAEFYDPVAEYLLRCGAQELRPWETTGGGSDLPLAV